MFTTIPYRIIKLYNTNDITLRYKTVDMDDSVKLKILLIFKWENIYDALPNAKLFRLQIILSMMIFEVKRVVRLNALQKTVKVSKRLKPLHGRAICLRCR